MTYLTETCSECDLDENSNRYLDMIREAEDNGDYDRAQEYSITLGMMYTVTNQLGKRAHHGYMLHGKNYIYSGDEDEIERMLRHPMPPDDFSWLNNRTARKGIIVEDGEYTWKSAKKIKIIPLKPKRINKGKLVSEDDPDLWMKTESTRDPFSSWNIIVFSFMFGVFLFVLLSILVG
jgi:hypothetical protein